MALQLALAEPDSGVGTAVAAAYVRIVQYTHDLKNNQLSMAVEYHYNAAAKNAGRNPIKGASYAFPESALSGTGGIKNQLYEYLKTLPEFAGATDV